MSQNKAKTAIFFSIILIVSSQILVYRPEEYEKTDLSIILLESAQSHTPIIIDGNSALDIFPNKTGSGIVGDPYIIENLEININGSGSGIEIKNTDKYLLIRNCTIENSGTLVNETDAGIKLVNADNIIISNNTLINNLFGIYLLSSFDNNITSNNLLNNSESGVFLLFSDGNSVSYNDITGELYGIRVGQSGNNEIFMNSITTENECILVESGANNDIHDNTLNCDGEMEPEPPGPPYPPYTGPPIFVIVLIAIVISVTVIIGWRILKGKKHKPIQKTPETLPQPTVFIDNVKKIKDLFMVSKSVRIEAVAEVLGMVRAELLQFIVENREKLPGIVIDGDFIKTDSVDDVSEFVDILDKQFETWKGTEKSKDGKI